MEEKYFFFIIISLFLYKSNIHNLNLITFLGHQNYGGVRNITIVLQVTKIKYYIVTFVFVSAATVFKNSWNSNSM